jgi:hypothetical protein
MRRAAAIGVDDDLPAGEPGVAVGTADREPPRRVDEEAIRRNLPPLELRHAEIGRHHLPHLALGKIRGMLRGDHDRIDAHGPAVLVSQRHLALGIGAQAGLPAGLAVLGHEPQDSVGELDRCWHQLGGLVAGIAEHEPLVPRALLGPLAGIDAHGDVRRLGVQAAYDLAVTPAEAWLVVADLTDRAARDFLDPAEHACCPPHLASDRDVVGRRERLAGDARIGIGGEIGVENRVRDPVADLVGMALRDRFAGEQPGPVAHDTMFLPLRA